MNTEQEAVVPSKEIRGTTAAALVDAAWAVDENSIRKINKMGKIRFFKEMTPFIRLYPVNE